MIGYFKLIGAVNVATTLNVIRTVNGRNQYAHMKLLPGVKYELEDDEAFLKSIMSAKVQKRYTKELEQLLIDNNVEYDKKMCASCGGKVMNLVYNIIDVVMGGEPDGK